MSTYIQYSWREKYYNIWKSLIRFLNNLATKKVYKYYTAIFFQIIIQTQETLYTKTIWKYMKEG